MSMFQVVLGIRVEEDLEIEGGQTYRGADGMLVWGKDLGLGTLYARHIIQDTEEVRESLRNENLQQEPEIFVLYLGMGD